MSGNMLSLSLVLSGEMISLQLMVQLLICIRNLVFMVIHLMIEILIIPSTVRYFLLLILTVRNQYTILGDYYDS
jgi:hypothetical protein